MQDEVRSSDGIRGYIEDAIAGRWTSIVKLLTSILITIWFIGSLLGSEFEGPLTAGIRTLRASGLSIPGIFQQFPEFLMGNVALELGVSHAVLVNVLAFVTALLALAGTYQRADNLIEWFAWIGFICTIEAEQSIATALFSIASTLVVITATGLVSYRIKWSFMSWTPMNVGLKALVSLLAPLYLLLSILMVFRRAFYLEDDKPLEVGTAFLKHLERLAECDPAAAEQIRLQVLLEAARSPRRRTDMSLIISKALGETPSGAKPINR